MGDFLIENEGAVRIAVFVIILAGMAGLERLVPKRPLGQPRLRRWFGNLAVVAIDTAALRLLFFFLPALAVGFAAWLEAEGVGLLNAVALPYWAEFLIAVLILDLVIYGQHVAFHHVPFLWRMHRMHHADLDIDVTTGLRFHPAEIVLSMLLKLAVIAALGAPALAVLVFEIALNGLAMFNHSNIDLPVWLERPLRRLIITPDVHRVHHSTIPREHNSNFGFNLSVWDRIFRTWRAQPEKGHRGMEIGLSAYRDGARQGLLWMMALPFRRL
ncbi:sterol desaturase family protein [Minwuia thermotolerans]|uniref:Fatty acid hydroxylase n=1 Tax=Minwuia thermotolerans TaxID=2056226 RepID=A0A2M9G3Z6_9PROT|nr:sterol desaturase family protein [Minwuia thermotolerans]PJK30418.1 fatty acid hydroxylase [Minwuia thermotolerans]